MRSTAPNRAVQSLPMKPGASLDDDGDSVSGRNQLTKVHKITEMLCETRFSRNTASRAFGRPGAGIPFPFVDGETYPSVLVGKVRQNDAVHPMRPHTVIGITAERVRKALGLSAVTPASHFDSWSASFTQLQKRGLHSIWLVVSDGHEGLEQAIAHGFPRRNGNSARHTGCGTCWTAGHRSVADRYAQGATPIVQPLQQAGGPRST